MMNLSFSGFSDGGKFNTFAKLTTDNTSSRNLMMPSTFGWEFGIGVTSIALMISRTFRTLIPNNPVPIWNMTTSSSFVPLCNKISVWLPISFPPLYQNTNLSKSPNLCTMIVLLSSHCEEVNLIKLYQIYSCYKSIVIRRSEKNDFGSG